MFSPSGFRDLVSGRKRGAAASALRLVLRLVEVPYSYAVGRRNRRYDTTPNAVKRASVPVVSVGNLTMGGTGKTPMVQYIAQRLAERGVRVTVISRGYGARSGGPNDEALQLAENLPDVTHLENPDRVAAARTAVERFDCQLIVLDDAFQHRRIGRDLDLVMIDALEPFGFGHVFPRGTLREPITGLRRADAVVLSRADMLDQSGRQQIRQEVQRLAPDAVWAEVTHAPRSLLSSSGTQQPIDSLAGQSVAAFCGVGNPAGFRHTLDVCRVRTAAFREFADHHNYDSADVESLARWADKLDVAVVLCTQKDLVKLNVDRLGRHPLLAVAIGLDFLAGGHELAQRLDSLL